MIWAYLKDHPRYVNAVFLGIGASALTLFLISALNWQHSFAVDQEARTTPDNVELRVRAWIDNFGLTVRRRSDTASTEFFRYVVTLRNADNIDVVRFKDKDHYIVLTSRLIFPPGEWSRLTPAQVRRASTNIILELTRARINYTPSLNFSQWQLERRMPITATLSESDFIGSIDAMDSALVSIQASELSALQ